MGKRGNGEGSIYQRSKDGRWVGALTLPTGKRKAVYGATYEEARSKLRQAERDQERGLDLSAKPQTVAQFLTDWLENTARPTIRPKTHHSYAQLIRLHLVPALGRIQLAKLTPQHVQKLMGEMTAKGLSPRTVQYARAILRRALGYALKWGLVTRNVATLVDPPRSVKKPVRPLTGDQARTFLAHLRGRDDRLWPFFTTAVLTGLRQAELLGLRWSDVDLAAGSLRVTATLQRIDREWRFVEPKTRRSARTLSLPSAAVAALKAQRVRQLEERLAYGEGWQDIGLVFTTPKGTPLEPSNLSKRLHGLLKSA
ncbi:MAG TPA: tyrosine-type recombinase/integrase, partial [Thermomicrobiales bacterium]